MAASKKPYKPGITAYHEHNRCCGLWQQAQKVESYSTMSPPWWQFDSTYFCIYIVKINNLYNYIFSIPTIML